MTNSNHMCCSHLSYYSEHMWLNTNRTKVFPNHHTERHFRLYLISFFNQLNVPHFRCWLAWYNDVLILRTVQKWIIHVYNWMLWICNDSKKYIRLKFFIKNCFLKVKIVEIYLQQTSKYLMLDQCQQVCPDVHRLWHFSHNSSSRRIGNRHSVAQEYSDMDTHCFDCMTHGCRIYSRSPPVWMELNEMNNDSAIKWMTRQRRKIRQTNYESIAKLSNSRNRRHLQKIANERVRLTGM